MKSLSKSIFILLTLLNLLKVSAVFAEQRKAPTLNSGGIAGNGGSGSQVQLAGEHAIYSQILLKISIFFTNYPEHENKFAGLNSRDLIETIANVDLEITNTTLVDDDRNVRTCLNFYGSNQIKCNYAKLQEIKDEPKVQFVLMFHEVLGLLGLEQTSPQNPKMIDGYKISKHLAPYVQKTSNWNLVPSGKNEKKLTIIHNNKSEAEVYFDITKKKAGLRKFWLDLLHAPVCAVPLLGQMHCFVGEGAVYLDGYMRKSSMWTKHSLKKKRKVLLNFAKKCEKKLEKHFSGLSYIRTQSGSIYYDGYLYYCSTPEVVDTWKGNIYSVNVLRVEAHAEYR